MALVSGAWGPPQVGGLYPCSVHKEAPESRAAGLGRPKTASSRGHRSTALDQHLPSHVLSPEAPSQQKATPLSAPECGLSHPPTCTGPSSLLGRPFWALPRFAPCEL